MNKTLPCLSTEIIKIRRSRVLLLTTAGFSLAPIVGGLFMIILKDPQAARSLGLISLKAQLVAGTADWPAMFDILAQSVAIGGLIVFSIITTWIFGREFSDHTVKDFLALPTSRGKIIGAKLIIVAVWCFLLTLFIYGLGLIVGYLVVIPGWSSDLLRSSFLDVAGASILTITLMPYTALFASMGRGYLPPLGWTFLSLMLAQVVALTGWGDYFPWSIPALFSGAAGPRAVLMGPHSYIIATAACIAGTAAVFWWWQYADQAG
jgi:ABC-2 type transport system permease protein